VPAPKRSLVRSAIACCTAAAFVALALEPPYRFAALRQPGIELLAELVALVRERPDIRTGGVLEHFGDREEAAALHKLATQTLPGEGEWEREFLDVMVQLEDQTAQQRIDELKASETPLNATEKNELRALLLDRQAAKR
jgi:DNA primase